MSFKQRLQEILQDTAHRIINEPIVDLDEAVDSITELVKGLVGEDEIEELNDFDWRKTRNELRRELKEKLK